MHTPNLRSEKGQIIILLAVGIVILLGFTALAIDGGMVFFDRRSAQNAADASALAGGYELAKNPWDAVTLRSRITAAAQGLASDNQYGEDSGKNVTVELLDAAMQPILIPVPPNPIPDDYVVDPNAGNTQYVRVTITSSVNTSFLHFVYNGPVLNAILSDPSTRALYLFPTKALAQDQLAGGFKHRRGFGGRAGRRL